jgi:hypothetical protein
VNSCRAFLNTASLLVDDLTILPSAQRSLIVSLLWCIYNAVPPVLMLYYAGFKEHGLAEVCRVASVITFVAGAGEFQTLACSRTAEVRVIHCAVVAKVSCGRPCSCKH